MISPSQDKELHVNYSTPTSKDSTEGNTTAVIAVMRATHKDDYHHHLSNKHYKQKVMRVLFHRRSDRDLVFVSKDKSMLLPYSKRLVPQSCNTSHGIVQTKCKARVELNLFQVL